MLKLTVRARVCVLLLSSLATSSIITQAADLDDNLSAWMNQRPSSKNQLTNETKDVLVFFEDPQFHDRSGLLRSHALEEEQTYVTSEIALNNVGLRKDLAGNSKVIDSFWSSNASFVRVDRASLKRLARRDDIKGILDNEIITLDAPILSHATKASLGEDENTYGLKLIHAPQAWEKIDKRIVPMVGIIDSGIDQTHPDLVDRVIAGQDFTSDGTIDDRNSHGTHVAGTIAGGNSSGTAIGVAPHAKLVIGKIFDDRGSTDLATILRAMEWIMNPDGDPTTDDAPRVVSNSWGASSQFILGFRNIVKTWRRFNIFPCFAAGNSGSGWMTTGAPGRYPTAFAVGALDSNQVVTSFSSRGPSFWFKAWGTREDREMGWFERWMPRLYKKPDIAAPGLDVLSSLPGGTYGRYTGTSMATPHITGVVALALSANPSLSVDQLENIIESTALDLGKPGHDNAYGSGLVQADKVVEAALALPNQSQAFKDTNPDSMD